MNTTATANQTRREVCKILGWNYQEYADFIYERGIAYLQWYLPAMAEHRDKLERSQLYWNWWKNLWKVRDDVFVYNMTSFPLKKENTLKIYRETHNAKEILLDGIRPPKYVTEVLFNEPQLKEVVYE